MPRTKEQNEEIKEKTLLKIRETGLKLFSYKGLAATSTSDIAKEAGVSSGLMYHYYRSKEDLYADLVGFAVRESNNSFRQVLKMPVRPLEKIIFLTKSILEDLEKNDQISQYFLLVTQALLNTDLPENARTYMDEVYVTFDIMKEMIIDGQRSGEIGKGDPEMLTTLYLSSIKGICTYKLILGERFIVPPVENMISLLSPIKKYET
ncbi:MAG: TetR/AcrR family transcriptional regulator [Bacteroidales bacterium]|jgi:AcrR family transcriptional regulator|nr:TetR/AcrR family transcriptional regulator [Bacteroidales bacterium]